MSLWVPDGPVYCCASLVNVSNDLNALPARGPTWRRPNLGATTTPSSGFQSCSMLLMQTSTIWKSHPVTWSLSSRSRL